MAGEKLAQMIMNAQGTVTDFSDYVPGVVTSVNPLKIKVENRFEVTEEFLILSTMVKDYFIDYLQTTVDVTKGTADGVSVVTDLNVGEVTKQAQVFFDLKVGEKVHMLRLQKGQLYYVIERGDPYVG